MGRESLLKVKVRTVDLPDGSKEWIRALNGAQLETLMEIGGGDIKENMDTVYRVVMFGLCDERGAPLFADDEIETVKTISVANAQAIAAGVFDFSGLKDEGLPEAKND